MVEYAKQLLPEILRNSTKKAAGGRQLQGKSSKDWKTVQEAGKTIKEMTAKHRQKNRDEMHIGEKGNGNDSNISDELEHRYIKGKNPHARFQGIHFLPPVPKECQEATN